MSTAEFKQVHRCTCHRHYITDHKSIMQIRKMHKTLALHYITVYISCITLERDLTCAAKEKKHQDYRLGRKHCNPFMKHRVFTVYYCLPCLKWIIRNPLNYACEVPTKFSGRDANIDEDPDGWTVLILLRFNFAFPYVARWDCERQELVHTRLQDARELIRPISGASEETQTIWSNNTLNPTWKLIRPPHKPGLHIVRNGRGNQYKQICFISW